MCLRLMYLGCSLGVFSFYVFTGVLGRKTIQLVYLSMISDGKRKIIHEGLGLGGKGVVEVLA